MAPENKLKISNNLRHAEEGVVLLQLPFKAAPRKVEKFSFEGKELPGIYSVEGVIDHLWHYSRDAKLELNADKQYTIPHKHGPGFYVGAGKMSGDQIRLLGSDPDAVKYAVSSEGKFLLVNLEHVEMIEILLADVWQCEDWRGTRALNTALRRKSYSGKLVYSDSEAEGVLFQPTEMNTILRNTFRN